MIGVGVRVAISSDPLSSAIRRLFSEGEQGAWYDPSDLSTLFQDAAGTTPVTADGDPVGLMLDKSGNGNHASQATSALRPICRTAAGLHWLEFDGVDDYINLGTSFFISRFVPFTINLWVAINPKPLSGTQSDFHRIISLRAEGASTFGIAYVNQLNSGYRGLYITNRSGWVKADTSFYPPANTWGMITLTYNGLGSTDISNFKMYWNTSPLTFNISGLATPGLTTDNNYIGARQHGDVQAYRGNISNVLIYNRSVTPAEVQQNFNAFRGRYGI